MRELNVFINNSNVGALSEESQKYIFNYGKKSAKRSLQHNADSQGELDGYEGQDSPSLGISPRRGYLLWMLYCLIHFMR